MRKSKLLLLLLCALLFLGASPIVFGHWNEGDPYKWVQYPDLSTNGIDINGTAYKLADDFQCTVTGPLTDFHIWCSWLDDAFGEDPHNVAFLIEIYDDVPDPDPQDPATYSHPGNRLWWHNFAAGDFTARKWAENIQEGWYDPGTDNYTFPADFTCWQYNFVLDPQDPDLFIQQGTASAPVTYWVAIQASPTVQGPLWGWKTSVDHWNDDAVYDADGTGDWKELIYPDGHDLEGQSIDLAFVITGEEQTSDGYDFGDAPENAIAYPGTFSITGIFPTCITVGTPGSYIQHDNYGAYFGPLIDREPDGNAGACPTAACFPPYDQDECFQDGDAGLIMPDSFTIDAANNIVTCTGVTPGTSLGQTCATAVWGTDIDIDVTNNMPNNTTGYVNVLVDWDRSGFWGGTATGACSAPEYVLDDFAVPNGYSGPLSALMAAGTGFTIGPNAGHVWVRFSITEIEVTPTGGPTNWDGSGIFEDGETEDYLLYVSSTTPPVTYEFEFSLDIGSDTEMSDPQLDGDEVFDPGDIYWWKGPLVNPPTPVNGFKDDELIFAFNTTQPDPWPDPDFVPWTNTVVPVGTLSPLSYHEWFDLDGHDQLENSLVDLDQLGGQVPGTPIPIYTDHCIHEPNHLAISYDDDQAPGWPGNDVPVTAPSPLGKIYGASGVRDEVIGVTVQPGVMPTTIVNIYPILDEKNLHPNLAPNPDNGDADDDDVDSLDVVPDEQSCPVLLFSPDHEATQQDAAGSSLDPGGIYERYAGNPVKVIDEETHLGILDLTTTPDVIEDADIDAFEFVWLPADVQGGFALALLFSVDEDDPLTPGIDESGGLSPKDIYYSFLTGGHAPYLTDLDDDVDALTNGYGATEFECVKSGTALYTAWVDAGKPTCWCYSANCKGDVDGIQVGFYRVQTNDLQILLTAFFQDPLPAGGQCANFDRIKVGSYYVQTNDLQTLLVYFFQAGVTDCAATDYNFWTD